MRVVIKNYYYCLGKDIMSGGVCGKEHTVRKVVSYNERMWNCKGAFEIMMNISIPTALGCMHRNGGRDWQG